MILFVFVFVHLEGFEVVDENVGHPQTVDQLKVDCNENRRQVRSIKERITVLKTNFEFFFHFS